MTERQPSLPRLRTTAAETDGAGGVTPLAINHPIEFLVDLLGATKIVPEERLALAGDRARLTGSFARALVDEGIATSAGIAHHHAVQFRLPIVDLATMEIDDNAV